MEASPGSGNSLASMIDADKNWMFAERYPEVTVLAERVRLHSLELGVTPISASVAAHLTFLARAMNASNIIEVGTGLGTSALALLAASNTSHLTTIEREGEHLHQAKRAISEAGVTAARTRFIGGDASAVLPRMNDGAYDLVFLDADPAGLLEYVEHALRLARVGGAIVIAHALQGDSVANPVKRDRVTSAYRGLLNDIAETGAVTAALTPVDDGLLQLIKITP